MPKPKMTKMFTGRGKTRPIPRIVDASQADEAKVVSAQQTPRSGPADKAFGPRPNMGPVAGSRAGSTGGRAGGYYPLGSQDNI